MRKRLFPVLFQKRDINRTAPAITPTLGSELLTDGGLEFWASPTDLTNWSETIAGTSTVNQETTTIHGGSNAARFDVDASNSLASINQSAYTVGNWYQLSAWAKSSSGTPAILLGDNSAQGISRTINTTYTQYLAVHRAKATSFRTSRDAGAASLSLYIDDVSAKLLTFSTCRVLMGNIGRKNGTYTCHPTVTAGTGAGMLIEYLDDSNFVIAWNNQTNAFLEKCIAGTYTTVKSGAITYSAGAELKVIVNGTTHKLYYNGTQVSTDGTIDNSALGTSVYAFNTFAGNSVGLVTTSP